MNNLIDIVTEQVDRLASMADIAGIEYSVFCAELVVREIVTVVKHVEPLPDVTIAIDESLEVPDISNMDSVTFCNITNSIDDKCFIIILRCDDIYDALHRSFHCASISISPNVFHKYLLEHDEDQYHINVVCVFHYNFWTEYTNKLREITDSLPNCINSTIEMAKRDQEKYELSQIKIKCLCGAHVLKYSMPRHILTLKHKNALRGSALKPLL
jgi:hypothetical protein